MAKIGLYLELTSQIFFFRDWTGLNKDSWVHKPRFIRIQLVYSTKDSRGFTGICWIHENKGTFWILTGFVVTIWIESLQTYDLRSQIKSNLLKLRFVAKIQVESRDSWDKSMFYGSVIQTLHPLFVFRLDMWEVNGFLSELKNKIKIVTKTRKTNY